MESRPPSSPPHDDPLQAARAAAEQSFRAIVAGVQDYAVFLLDANGHVASWNAGAARLKGYRADEIIGKHFSVFYPEEAVARHWPDEELETAARVGRFEDEGWRVRKDGSRFWANVAITALYEESGRIVGFLKITRDLSERMRAEETLRQSEEKFRLLVEGVQDYAIFMLDPGGRIASWNVGAERIDGYGADEIIGKHFSIFYPPEAIAEGKPERMLREARGTGRAEDEGWRLRKSGERFWANVVITALHAPDGSFRGYAKVTRDLTERRRVQALQEADRQKNEFLALLAHELRNPLAPIRMALHVLGRPGAAADTVERARAIATRQVQHMARLLEDLLDVSRVTQGRVDLRREPIDLRDVVVRTVEAMETFFVERRIQLVVESAPEPLPIFADPARLEQILTNLLTNALKYTDPGGTVRVRSFVDSGEVVLEVADTGIGIAAESLPSIFDLFVQAERRTERSRGGVGIGLTLVKKLVELHGGTVSAASPGRGKGSRFTIRLPAVADRPASPAAPETDPRPSAVARVLIVDDNPDAAESLSMMMRFLGQDVRTAFDGPSALEVAGEFRPAIVFLDIGMPMMDGYEVARRLRADPRTRNARLVALTGWGQHEDRARSEDAGFDEHLVKPADPLYLEKILVESLSGSGRRVRADDAAAGRPAGGR